MKIWVTILAVLIGVAVIFGVMRDSSRTNVPADDAPVAEVAPTQDTPSQTDVPEEAVPQATAQADTTTDASPSPASPAVAPPQVEQADAIPGLHAVTIDEVRTAVIGYDGPKSPFKMRVVFTRYGAGIYEISLADYLKTVGKPDHYVVHERLALPDPSDRTKLKTYEYAYAALAITVNGTTVPLKTNDAWIAGDVVTDDRASSVTYTATLADAANVPVLKIERTYTVKAGSYDLDLDQRVINLADQPLSIRWAQNLQGDLVNDSGYLGDRRQYVSGYFALWWDAQKAGIYTQDAELARSKVVGSKSANVWPPHGLNPKAELAWVASLNRYFAVVTHAELDDSITVTADVPPLQALFPHIGQSVIADPGVAEPKDADKVMVLNAATAALTLSPGGQLNLDLGVFAGPRKPELFDTPPYSTLHLDQTIVYSLGGMCSFCTFQWLAHGLLWLLKLFEGQILVIGGVGIGVHDWGLSIILLVLVVRLILHPITKKAQINMMKMGKMMQAIQPEVEKLKKKYKDDQQKINTEMMKLYREKGVNPANVLGCLPMFLQTPIWIALYAMLYYAIELRHEPAFWGLFQSITGGAWGFLRDLSSQDNFIQVFDEPHKINVLISTVEFQSVNIIPLLMGVVFYFQQKLTTPPAANEQQAQQQKMMKFMILLFPVFLYFAPSGLNLYILASTGAGIVDSYIVRKHIKEQEASGELFKPKPVKPGGLRERIARAVETKQQQMTQKQQQHKGGNPRKRK